MFLPFYFNRFLLQHKAFYVITQASVVSFEFMGDRWLTKNILFLRLQDKTKGTDGSKI